MVERYEGFFSKDWDRAYSFWHKIIDRGDVHIRVIIRIIKSIGKKEIKILDLGCGEGDELKAALDKFPDKEFRIIANDVSETALERYAKNNKKYLEKTLLCRLEEVPDKINEKFDLVFFSHALYGVDVSGLFEKYLKMLDFNGILLIFLESEKSNIVKIRKKFWKKIHGADFDETTAEKVIEELSREGIKPKIINIRYFVDFNKLNEIEAGGVRNLYIPFLFRTNKFDKIVLEKIEGYIAELCAGNKLENKTLGILFKKE